MFHFLPLPYRLLIVILLTCGFESIAQTRLAQLMNDRNITWLQTYTINVAPHVDLSSNQKLGFKRNWGNLLKFQAQPTRSADIYRYNDFSLTAPLFNALKTGKVQQVYHDRELSNKVTQEALKAKLVIPDTTRTFDPETFEEVLQIAKKDIKSRDIIGYQQYGAFYYHEKENTFKAEVFSVAPILASYTDEGVLKAQKVLFWIPVGSTETTNLNNPSIIWASRVVAHVPDEGVTQQKGLANHEIWETFFTKLRANPTRKVYDAYFDLLGHEPFSEAQVKDIGHSVDSIVTFDLNFDETIQVVHNELDIRTLKPARLIQDWIWDDQQQRLFIRYLGFAPMLDRFDDGGGFLRRGPTFYIRMDHVR